MSINFEKPDLKSVYKNIMSEETKIWVQAGAYITKDGFYSILCSLIFITEATLIIKVRRKKKQTGVHWVGNIYHVRILTIDPGRRGPEYFR